MKIAMNWLRDHLNTELSYLEILKNLNRLGFELKKEYRNPLLWNSIEIVKIIKKINHPNANKLNLYTIKKIDGEELTIVCGDESLNEGDFVPYARPGTVISSGGILQVKKIRGIESIGMLCSPEEIDLPIQSYGVLKCFENDYGKSISQAYESEAIFEIELTPNRGDALSILGIARILANSSFGTLIENNFNEFSAGQKNFFEIKTLDCKGLICTLFNHQIGNTEPKLAKKLQLTGHSFFNIDVIDLTNYICHDLGQPMHVFDYEKINKEPCSIENLETDQEFETLNQQKIVLQKGTLVFKSGEKIISWPTIIGGNISKVDRLSNSILLEAGVFKTDAMQRRKYEITTSASKKAEYGTDPFILKKATNMFISLLKKEPIFQQYEPFKESKKIYFNFNKVKEILGDTIDFENFKTTMERKNFIFNEDSTITPPNYKFFDISTQNCIVEEFAIDRYDSIQPMNLPPKYPVKQKFSIRLYQKNIIEISLNLGFNECKNIALGKKESSEFQISLENRQIFNYSNQNYSTLRGSLIPDLLKNMSWHIKNQQKITKFFELGLIYGQHENKQYLMFTAISNKIEDLKNLFSKILENKFLKRKIICKSTNLPYSEHSSVFFFNDKELAKITKIKQSILKEFNLKTCFSLEIHPDVLEGNQVGNNSELSDLPPIYQDITLRIKKQIPACKITNFLNSEKINYKILTIYPSNNINEERRLTVQLKIDQPFNLTKEQINKKVFDITNKINELIQ